MTTPNKVVIAGPYGAGQELLVEGLLESSDRFVLGKSDTTRLLRPGEQEDRYTPRTPAEFAQNVQTGYYAEHDTIGPHWYGTPWQEIGLDRGGKTLILSVSVLGACALRHHLRGGRAISIFVEPSPPSAVTLAERLEAKGLEKDELRPWLVRAQQEMKLSSVGMFDHVITLWDKDQALEEFFAVFPMLNPATA